MTGNRGWGNTSAPEFSSAMSSAGSRRGVRRRMSNDPDVVEVITKDLIRKIRYILYLVYVLMCGSCNIHIIYMYSRQFKQRLS